MTEDEATRAYVAKILAVREKILAAQRLLDDHCGHDPDDINWGHVGDMGRVGAALDEVLILLKKGE